MQLKSKIVRQQALRDRKNRKRSLAKYIPNVTAAVFAVLSDMADREDAPAAKRARMDDLARKVLEEVGSGQVTEEVLARKLHEHVERTDLDAALEYQVAQGAAAGAQKDLFLVPKSAQHEFAPEMHAPGCAVKLLAAALVLPDHP